MLGDADNPGQSVLEDGVRVSAETSQRLACDASRVIMRHDSDGRLLEISARTRTIPPALRRALQHRDQGCRFPGCGARFGQGHHIRHWAQGGPTTLSNLALLCRRHHRAVHEEGYQVERQADGDLQFRHPSGGAIPTSRRRPRFRAILHTRSERGTKRKASCSTHTRLPGDGSASAWTWATRWMSSIRWR